MDGGFSSKGILRLQRNTVEKVLMVLSGLSIMYVGFNIWNHSVDVPGVNILAVLIIGGGLFGTVMSFYVSNHKGYTRLETFLFILMIVGFVVWAYCSVYTNSFYGTDELAFDQWAAELLSNGVNPYGVDLSPSLIQYHVPVIFKTYTLTGGTVNLLSYPALSFLFYVPFTLMGLHIQLAVYVDTAFWLITMVTLHFLLPRPYKLLSILLGLRPLYIGYVIGGVTDALFMPFLLLAAFQWDRFGDRDARWTKWLGPIGLGLAACIKQTAWFIAPFVLVGIYRQTKSLKSLMKYCIVAFISFLVPNLPFIITKPFAWLTGIFAPFLSSTIPSGQGLINLSMIDQLGGGSLKLYTLSALMLLLTLLVATAVYFPRLKRLIFILPSIVMFFPTRSFSAYLINLIPVFVLSALTANENEKTTRKATRVPKRMLVLAPAVLFVLVTILAVTLPSPLKMSIRNVHTTGQLQTVDSISVVVSNRYRRVIQPHFTITMAPQLTSFWLIKRGPTELQPGETATYQLDAPNVSSMPNIDAGFILDAFTNNPASISTAPLYEPRQLHTYITPPSIDTVVPINQSVDLTVQLFDRVGRPVKTAGVPVYLGQVVYDQNNLDAGQSSINGSPEGKSPVMSVTNDKGEAVFHIVDKQLQDRPIYYQAFVEKDGQFPFGYSQVVDIRFGPRSVK